MIDTTKFTTICTNSKVGMSIMMMNAAIEARKKGIKVAYYDAEMYSKPWMRDDKGRYSHEL